MSKSAKSDKDNNSRKTEPTSRRSFLNVLWTVLGIAAAAEFIVVITRFLGRKKTGSNGTSSDNIIQAGSVESFPNNSVTANIQGRFYLVRLDDGGFIALSSKCTHLGCTVPWDDKEKRFECPCHGSSFDITGKVLTSPAPRPLDHYPVSIENNMVIVDTGSAIKREKFLKEQLVYSKKVQS